MMKDLGNTVVREHGEGVYASAGSVWEEGMWCRGVGGKEGGPGLSDENLGALPEEDYAHDEGEQKKKGAVEYVPRCPPRDRSSLKEGKVSVTIWTRSSAVPLARRDLWKAFKKPAYDPPKFCMCVTRTGIDHGPDG